MVAVSFIAGSDLGKYRTRSCGLTLAVVQDRVSHAWKQVEKFTRLVLDFAATQERPSCSLLTSTVACLCL